jgi:hypothetical protein
LKQSREPRVTASGPPQVQKDLKIIKYSQAVWSGAAQILKQSREPRVAASGPPQVQKDLKIIKYSQAVLERSDRNK